jgi:hypothetical protein
MSTDPYAAPTDEEWAAIEARFAEAERIWRTATDEYLAAFEVWRPAVEQWQAALHEWQRLSVLRTPVRDWVIQQLRILISSRPLTVKKIDPYHRPADVQQVLDDLIAEGKVRQVGKGYECVGPRRLTP